MSILHSYFNSILISKIMSKSYLFLASLLLFSCVNSEQRSSASADNTAVSKPSELIGKEVSYEADSVSMKGYLVYDSAFEGPRPGVLVVHEWWGQNEHTRNSADKLARAGYIALAIDMYGDGKSTGHPQDAMAFSSAVMSDFPGAKNRFEAAMKVLQDQELCTTDELSAIGYCFGGGIVLNMARQGVQLDGVASFHGSIDPIEPAGPGDVQAKILIMNGADDPFVSAESKTALHNEMKAAGVDYEFIDYPDAVHAFTNPAATAKGEEFELPLAYNEAADKASWDQLMKFLEALYPRD
jgi:dienelactone hydrolase